MPNTRVSTALAGILVAATFAPLPAGAEDFDAGREEYLAACAACHGETADGNGPMAEMFKAPVPDLTGIAARDDGVFPTRRIMEIIDGRAEVRGHGNPMPVFGNRFVNERVSEKWYSYSLGNSEQIARGRVLELVLYLQSIQQ